MLHDVAALIVNYNMPERADALAMYILKNSPCDVYLIDNGSDLKEPANLTNIRIRQNVQTTNGWLIALDNLPSRYFAYWFLITSAEFVGGDALTPMVRFLRDNPEAAGIHPALTDDSTTEWYHMKARGTIPRRTWMFDNIASLYRADWFDSIGRFDPKLIYGWGIDLETCYQARKQNKSLWMDDRVRIRKDTDIGYKMGRMNMTATDRRKKAYRNMKSVLSRKYGQDWQNRMMNEYVLNEWR